MDTVDLNTRLVRNPDLVSTDMDGETVMLSIARGSYYGTRGVAARVWELLERPATPSELCATICREYDVDPSTCQSDVIAFLGELLENDLVHGA